VELAVDDDPGPPILARDWLMFSRQVDDAEPRMPESDSPDRYDPMPLRIGSTVMKALGCPLHHRSPDRIMSRENIHTSAHLDELLGFRAIGICRVLFQRSFPLILAV